MGSADTGTDIDARLKMYFLIAPGHLASNMLEELQASIIDIDLLGPVRMQGLL